jgi:hypothetical protein
MAFRARGALALARRLRCVGAPSLAPPPYSSGALLEAAAPTLPRAAAHLLAPYALAGFHAAAPALEARARAPRRTRRRHLTTHDCAHRAARVAPRRATRCAPTPPPPSNARRRDTRAA